MTKTANKIMPESGKKYRLITRSDMDGLVCGILLKELDLIDDVMFAHPKDMQDGLIEVGPDDITTNLPYVETAYLAFDHHASEASRVSGAPANHVIDVKAPSAARVVYDYFGGASAFPRVSDDMMDAVDKADSADFSKEEILTPGGWVLLSFLMDARTGLGRFRDFNISNYQLMMKLIDFCRDHNDIDEILDLPDVRERVDLYFDHQMKCREQIERCATVHNNLVVLDLRKEETIWAGNRFVIYALFPQCNISIHILWGKNKQNTVFATGKSILDRSSKTNVGELMLKYGGGGHNAAGTCQITNLKSEDVLQELIQQINADGQPQPNVPCIRLDMKLLRNMTGYRFALSEHVSPKKSRRERLANIIRFANANTPFYKGKFDALVDSEKDLSDEEFFYAFSHLPIVEKQDLKDTNDSFKSDHISEKVDLLEGGKPPSFSKFFKHAIIKKDFFATLSTGGSSGVPTFRWLDYPDANLFAQSFLHSFKLNGWKQGESFVVYYPLKSYFTGAYADHAKTLSRYFGFTMVPFEEVTKESVENLLKTLRSTNATLLVIFPCVLQRIAEIMHKEGMEPFDKLPYINVSGEFFLDCSKRFIQKMFPDSDIQITYGAVEFGEIAHQTGLDSFNYNIFDEYVYMEQGPGNSMLVTAYHQKAFPLIRYKIEDMGQIINHEDGSQSIRSLEGKNEDYLVGADNYMYFASFFNNFVNELNKALNNPIIHFMLRHEDKDGRKYMNLNFVLEKTGKEDKIKEACQKSLGEVFANYDEIIVNFPEHFEHDYTRKFKIIGEGDGMAEVVGGYYQRKAS